MLQVYSGIKCIAFAYSAKTLQGALMGVAVVWVSGGVGRSGGGVGSEERTVMMDDFLQYPALSFMAARCANPGARAFSR